MNIYCTPLDISSKTKNLKISDEKEGEEELYSGSDEAENTINR